MSGIELPPKISDEMARAFNRAFNEAYDRLGDEEPYGAVRAGLAAALVASGCRREADVLREAADTIEARYPAEIWHPASTSPDAMAAKGVRVACNQLRHMAETRDRATALEPALPLADGLEGQERSEEKRCPNCAPGYDCERGIYEPVSSTGEETTDGR